MNIWREGRYFCSICHTKLLNGGKNLMLTAPNGIMKKKIQILFPAILASMLFYAQAAFAYVDYKTLSVPAIAQEQSNWCWATVTQMIAKYFGANATQTDIVTYVKGSPVNQTGTVYDMQKGLSKYNITSTPSTSTISFGTVISEINNNQPIGTVILWKSGSGGHAHAIRGYYEDTSNSTQNLYYIDPGDASYNIMSYSNYLNNSSFYWVNTLHAIYVG
jgi:hypothetical protein